MRILIIGNFHHKNKSGLFEMLTKNNVDFELGDNSLIDDFDVIYSPSNPIDTSEYPGKKFIFGPHFSTFMDTRLQIINNIYQNAIYIQPSIWAKDAWTNQPHIPIKVQPFPVNTSRFCPIDNKKTKVFIYFKRRKQSELDIIENFCINKGYDPIIFNYLKKYNEDDYLNVLQNSMFGIILDAHESQGFAIQEALSCNVPLLVWSATSMEQEEGSHFPPIEATTIPYWDDRCGEVFTNECDLEQTFETFISKFGQYKPRDYIMENLSIEPCYNIFLNNIKSIPLCFHVITGANKSYCQTLLSFINNYKYPYETLTVYDLGLDDQRFIIEEKQLQLGFILKTFDYDLWPEHVNLNKYNGLYCSYAFKPIIAYLEAQIHENKTLIWSDCANEFTNSTLKQSIKSTKKNGIYIPIGNLPNTIETLELNHPKTLEYYNISKTDLETDFYSLLAGYICFDYNKPHVKTIIDTWYNDSLNKDIIMPKNSSRNNHRQDLTVLSCIIYKWLKFNSIAMWQNSVSINFWKVIDKRVIDNRLKPYKLMSGLKQLAIVYCETYEEAKSIYLERKNISEDLFDQTFVVEL